MRPGAKSEGLTREVTISRSTVKYLEALGMEEMGIGMGMGLEGVNFFAPMSGTKKLGEVKESGRDS